MVVHGVTNRVFIDGCRSRQPLSMEYLSLSERTAQVRFAAQIESIDSIQANSSHPILRSRPGTHTRSVVLGSGQPLPLPNCAHVVSMIKTRIEMDPHHHSRVHAGTCSNVIRTFLLWPSPIPINTANGWRAPSIDPLSCFGTG